MRNKDYLGLLPAKEKPLAFLPNVNGFAFTGIKHDGSKIQCYVKFSFEGQYVALSVANNERVFNQLRGWI